VVLLRPDPATTVRIAGADVKTRQWSPRSVMPEGLLDKMTPQQIADLAAYLAALRR
jgi:cytochrome c553